MFQREVADRLVASVGDDAYGRLSIIAQWRSRPRILFDVNPRAFTPAPKVTSSVVKIEPLAEPIAPASLKILERVTGAAFSQRRKMLRSSLRQLTPRSEDILMGLGIHPTVRAEELAVADFCRIANALREARG